MIIFYILHDFVLFILSWVLPKKDRISIVLCKNNFLGNLKYFYDYLKNKGHSDIYIITNSRELCRLMNKDFPNSCKISTIKSIWYLATSGFIIVDHNTTGFRTGFFMYISNVTIFQLWHGSGFKQIGILAKKIKKGVLGKMELWDYKLRRKKYVAIFSTSDIDAQRKRESFLNNNTYITGNPRNDMFFLQSEEITNIKAKFELTKYNKIISYTPTFRTKYNFYPFTLEFLFQLNKWLKSKNYIFIIKKHPNEKIDYLKGKKFSNIVDLTQKASNVQDLLFVTDILISDYSGIVTDFSISGRPILFYFVDYNKFIEIERGFYYTLYELLPGPFLHDEYPLLEALKELDLSEESNIDDNYKNFRDTFHKYLDGNASKRVYDIIISKTHK